jgi:hypothetical protein
MIKNRNVEQSRAEMCVLVVVTADRKITRRREELMNGHTKQYVECLSKYMQQNPSREADSEGDAVLSSSY